MTEFTPFRFEATPMFGTHTHQQFADALSAFVDGCDRLTNEPSFRTVSPGSCRTLSRYEFSIEWLQKRIRIVRSYGGTDQRSVHCFVDIATGDVLKAGGWKAPAPNGVRGNIYDASGLKCMDRYGCLYLR